MKSVLHSVMSIIAKIKPIGSSIGRRATMGLTTPINASMTPEMSHTSQIAVNVKFFISLVS